MPCWNSPRWSLATTWAFQCYRLLSVSPEKFTVVFSHLNDKNCSEFNNLLVFLLLFSFQPAFHYPELNTSQVLRSSWLRTGRLFFFFSFSSCRRLISDVRPFTDIYVCICAQCCWVCRTRRWARGPSKPAWSDGWPCCLAKRWDWSDVSKGLHPLATAVFRY